MTTLSSSDHGHVFRRTEGYKASCGGPDYCAVCRADLALFAALGVSEGQTETEREIQRTFDNVRADT
jgi:hypothetical protein